MSVWPWSKGSVLLCAWVMLSAIPSAKSLAVACVACFVSVCGAGILTCATLAPTFQPCAAALCGPGAFLACAVPCGVGIFAETCHVTEEAALQTEIAPATLSADQAVMAMEHAVRYLASPGTQTMQFPVCRVEWLADAVVPASDGLIHYRSWLDAAVSAATSQDVKVSLAVANVGCGWPMGLQGLQTSSSWALFWEEIAAHFSDNALVNVALNASADTIEVQWPSSPTDSASDLRCWGWGSKADLPQGWLGELGTSQATTSLWMAGQPGPLPTRSKGNGFLPSAAMC
ncbi:unnamed protein product [Polarella glacialis]|uniref:Uncharacterized protein n=2 Tax=Polarella glacialis TaxID=89957 RepID=A0A813H5Q3_POLGL|nr:unnamed protein product [Polarella glacialis]